MGKIRSVLGITIGDPSGIGPEIAVKALEDTSLYEICIPVLIGDAEPVEEAVRFCNSPLKVKIIDSPEDAEGKPGTIEMIDLDLIRLGEWTYGTVCKSSGESSFQYILTAIRLAMEGKIQGIVTGPINKEAINLAGYNFAGHTEILAHFTETPDCAMLLTSKELNVIHVTTHVSMREACDIVLNNPERVKTTIRLAHEAMLLLGHKHPRVAVAGLNAHSSENGLFGNEEAESIIPAIEAAQAEGIQVDGPVPPDTVFVKAIAGQYDVVVAMYHDQGHIPLKLNGFQMDPVTKSYTSVSGVNSTIGLPIIRTSVDHGTAFGKAGTGRANEESLIDAIRMADQMARTKFKLGR